MKVFLYRDQVGASKIWHKRFAEELAKKGITYINIEFDGLFKRPRSKASILKQIRSQYEQGDLFICRIEERRYLRLLPWYEDICNIFGNKFSFPNFQSLWFYDNKNRQKNLFEEKGYPIPKQSLLASKKNALIWMKHENLDLPIVRKDIKGSGSKTVSLIQSLDTSYPCLLQEFCPNNSGDFRICTIGTRVMGFYRGNRENDFRASGSGKLNYHIQLPEEAVAMAFRISTENNFPCMAYDFVQNSDNQWVVIEMSYTFDDGAVENCDYYLEGSANFEKRNKIGVSPEEMIIEDLLSKGATKK